MAKKITKFKRTAAEKKAVPVKPKPGPAKGTKYVVRTKDKRPTKEERLPGYTVGQPSLYRPEYDDIAKKACELGATTYELAEMLNVSHSTLNRWSHEHASFCVALKIGRELADQQIEQALFHRAKGYTFRSEKLFFDAKMGEVVRADTVEHVPPSEVAQIFWLSNRKRAEWRRNQPALTPDGEDGDNGADAVAHFEALVTAAERKGKRT